MEYMLTRKGMEFSSELLTKLNILNNHLIEIETKTFHRYKILEKNCKKLKLDNKIDCFKIDLSLECYVTENIDEPLITTFCNFVGLQEGLTYCLTDFNDTNLKDLQLDNKHCYSFHHLYDHTELTFVEMSKIHKIWYDIKIDYQFVHTF